MNTDGTVQLFLSYCSVLTHIAKLVRNVNNKAFFLSEYSELVDDILINPFFNNI